MMQRDCNLRIAAQQLSTLTTVMHLGTTEEGAQVELVHPWVTPRTCPASWVPVEFHFY